VFRGHVSGTHWDVVALPDAAYIAHRLGQMQQESFYTWLLILFFLLLVGSLWWFEISRGRHLLELNETLEEEVLNRSQTEEQLRKLTNFDPLTSLPNRQSIDNYFQRLLETLEEERHRPAVLFFDLDRFQDINDTLGHGYGDVLLKEVASRVKEMMKPQDLLARWGGDEFVIVMENIRDESEVAHFANELLIAMREPIQLHRQAVTTTISIGVSVYPEAGDTAELLLKNADLAMYRAKNDGRNRFRFFLQEMDDIANERIRLETAVREAIKQDEFVPYYQPRMDLRTGAINGCEVLMRWQQAEGVLTPGIFLPVLEETGMIEAAGMAVRDKVCFYAREWARKDLAFGVISMNLGGKEFFRQDIVEQLSTVVSDYGLDASSFEIEITEGHLMENTADSLGKLHALKNIGFSIAVDDFGTGYSSLSYLRRFPVDVVKIDQSFVKSCIRSMEDQEIIRAIVSLGHSLDLRIVAEGVESVAQMELLRAIGCDELQGYFIGYPMSADEYVRFITAKKMAN
jgi:diguanylate cyclase (GGDEF)-like protein